MIRFPRYRLEMPLESVTHISDLVVTNPVGATDPKSQGDDHLRNIKFALKTDFPNINAPVTATPAQLNQLASGIIAHADGAVNAPSITFTSDTDLGFYRIGANTLGVSGGNSLVGQFNAAGFGAFAGAAGAPGIYFIGDTDSGLRSAVANQILVTVGGNDRVRISNAAEALAISGADATGDCFMSYYENNAFTTRKGYVGYGNVSSEEFSIMNEENSTVQLGTNGAFRWQVAATGHFEAISNYALRAGDGSAATPALAFVNDNDCGLYVRAANSIGLASNGQLGAYLTAPAVSAGGAWVVVGQLDAFPSGGLSLDYIPASSVCRIGARHSSAACDLSLDVVQIVPTAVGSAGTPVYTFANDENTGFYRPNADDIWLALGGVGFPMYNGVAVKTADTSRNTTTTFADDAHLTIAVPAGGKYAFELLLSFDGTTTGTQGFKWQLVGSGTINNAIVQRQQSINGAQSVIICASQNPPTASFATIGTSPNSDFVWITGTIDAAAAQTIKLQWAQASSSANNTNLRANSRMSLQKLN